MNKSNPNSNPLTTLQILNYQVIETVYSGSRTLVYRGIRTSDQLPVIIKLLKNDYPSFSELVQFRNQYTIAKNLNSPLIVQTYSLEPYRNSYALVMEDFGGISLQEWAQKGKNTLSLTEFLQMAITLCDALDILYRDRIIHKDIKPSNILINPETTEVKLIDFSIASLLPRETQTLINPNILEGTLAYISPEQTGRMNRGIDYRSDFYSLGVTFYELLTGELPFQSNDPMELVHSHIAKLPPLLSNRDEIPLVIADIITKLMAKNAEDRYQSALGLKFDLEKCLHQLQVKGAIKTFKIAERDLCDRFTIPDKLYGRANEVQVLLNTFDRVAEGSSEMMLVAGFSGIGKTAIINEVHKPIVRQCGYFIKGKFDQFNRNIPLSAFVQALRDFMGQLLSESDAQLQAWKAKILSAVGDNGQVLIEVIPELELIIGQQPIATELSGSAAQNRFNLLFQKFIEVFTTAEHPLVVCLDDLQWADSASLQLLKLLMTDNGYLLMLGAYRDNEVSAIHPFILTVEEIKKTNAIVNTITLKSLDLADTNHLVADTLNCSRELAQPLTELIDRKTQGNPFFTTQFLKALYEENCITFDRDRRYWECDIAQVNALALTDDVVEFMALQLQKLSPETQQVLKLAACIGNQFDLTTLAIVLEQSPTEAATGLWKALQEGLILPTSQVYKFFQGAEKSDAQNSVNPKYRFLHDRVQQAAYSLIPDEQKQATHLKIGQLLDQNLSETAREEKVFEIVGHFNLGMELITQPQEREALAQLNLAAGEKAKNSTAYSSAKSFVKTGIDLLTDNCWQCQYELTLNLYIKAAEVAYLNADFEEMEKIVDLVMQSARTILDTVKIYEIQINALTAQTKLLEAIAVGSKALTQLGFEFSPEPDDAITNKLLQTVTEQLQDKQIEELLDMPLTTDPQVMAAIQVLAITFTAAIVGNPSLIPLMAATIVNLSLEFGNAPGSAVGYISYGLVQTAFLGEVETGYAFGRLAINFIERFNIKELKSMMLDLFGLFIQHRCEPLRGAILTMKQTYLVGMETGDLLYASYGIGNYFDNNFFAGIPLHDWQPEMENYGVALAAMKQDSALVMLKMKQQIAQNFIEIVDRPDLLTGTAYDENQMLLKHYQDNDRVSISFLYIYKTILAYFFSSYTDALEYINQANLNAMATAGMVHTSIFHFYAGLTYLKLFSTQPETEQANILALAETHQTTLTQWAYFAPMNHQHKVDLIEAEKCRVLGQKASAIEFYDKAIAGAKANEYIQEEGLANELTAKFYLDWGKEKIAAVYMQEAYYCYAQWGAKAKTNDLETRYAHLLRPILESAAQPINVLETFASMATPHSSLHSSTISSNSSSISINSALDFAAILKASQSIAGTIQLDELLHQLTRVILQNSGGDRCALILPSENQIWEVRAIATPSTTELCSDPLENNPNLPVKLIQYVKNTQQIVVIDDLETNLPVIGDYLRLQQPKSVLCLPLLNQGHLTGILYLNNRLTSGVFTSDRLTIIKFLSTQVAISLENARLYNQVQQTLTDLQNAQLQIVQSEKMSALGNLVAGVAHEINNPVGCIIGNVSAVQDSINDLFGLIDLYNEKFPQPGTEIEEELETIDLEYLRDDLPNLIRAMKDGGDRIKSISKSLRTFSRADTDQKQKFNLHEGIDSTILILRHRLKANDTRPAIEVITNYGNIPAIDCFPGQLNQVFMNILANAIDALEESNQGRSFAEIKANPNKITITTTMADRHIQISILDNGKGMTEEIKNKVFDHLFTTKEVGKGTGLGLAIARQIVVETHGGKLQVNSHIGQGTEFVISLPQH